MDLAFPSKSFLIGEYGALIGGDAIVLNTRPVFRARTSKLESGQSGSQSFHPQSPAGRLVANIKELQNVDVELSDPWAGTGGFGASSAQFLAFEYHRQVNLNGIEFSAELARESFLQLYQEEAQPPSGYDILAQAYGHVTVISDRKCSRHFWSWQQLEFLVFPTGHKLPTHDHLKALNTLNLEAATQLAEHAVSAFFQQQGLEFVRVVGEFRNWLKGHQLEAPNSTEMIEALMRQPGVLVAKGCGALGADAIVVLHEPSVKISLMDWLKARGITNMMNVDDLQAGLL